jgi:copper homeostasis protein
MPGPVLIEVCVDSVASAIAAERGGAARVELCSCLTEGGITPSAGMIESVRHKISIGLYVMIRPRPGDFCYEAEEFEIMGKDTQFAKSLGADGVVLGVLDPAGHVDVSRTRELVELARPMSVTFHRAFDMSPDLFRALEDICDAGADRVLTSGGEQNCTLGAETIAQLVKTAGQRITIMAGRGINATNAAGIIERTGVSEIHVGMSTRVASPMTFRKTQISMGKVYGREYLRRRVFEENVRKLQHAVLLVKT